MMSQQYLKPIPDSNPQFNALNSGLRNFWKMNEATGETRADVLNNDNLVNTNACAQVAGIVGFATSFVSASSQKLTKAGYSAFDGATKASISCWVKRAAAGSDVIAVAVAIDNNNRFEVAQVNDGNAYFLSCNAGSQFGTAASAGTGWHHLVMVFDGTLATNANRLKGYIDGVLQTLSFTGTIPATLPTLNATIGVGVFNPATTVFSNGNLDAIGIWPGRALAQSDVTLLYNSGVPLEYQGGGEWATAFL